MKCLRSEHSKREEAEPATLLMDRLRTGTVSLPSFCCSAVKGPAGFKQRGNKVHLSMGLMYS